MSPTAVEQPDAAAVKAISAIAGVISLLMLVQAVTGGVFAREINHKGLINAHQGVAYLTLVLAVALVVVAVLKWRGKVGGQAVLGEAAVLAVLLVIEIGIGMQIGDLNKAGTHPGVLAIHIPLALLVFGISVHLPTVVANVGRRR